MCTSDHHDHDHHHDHASDDESDYSDFSDSDLLALGSRTYHPSYLLPTDQDEEIRLKFAHDIWRDHLGGKPFLSTLPPADGEFKILDLGSGFGHWALEVAALYPDADVLGFDLNAVQIEVDEVPKNVEFAVGDLEEPRWGVGRGFGFVHGRGLGGSIEDWGSVLRRAWRHLTPHGHLELAERALTPTSLDATYKPNTALHTYYTHLTTALQRLNRTVGITEELKNLVLEAGFEDVQEVRGFIPVRVGADMTEMEKFVLFVVLESFEAWGLRAFVEVLGMGVDEARAVCENAAKELREGGVRIGFRTVVVTARKPRGVGGVCGEDDLSSEDEEAHHHHHHHDEETDSDEYTSEEEDESSSDPSDSETEREPVVESTEIVVEEMDGKIEIAERTPSPIAIEPPVGNNTTTIEFDSEPISPSWDNPISPCSGSDDEDEDNTVFTLPLYKRARDKAADAIARSEERRQQAKKEERRRRKKESKARRKERERLGGGSAEEGDASSSRLEGNDSGFVGEKEGTVAEGKGKEKESESRDGPAVQVRETPPEGVKAERK